MEGRLGEGTFSEEESQLILSIPLSKYPTEDKIVWLFSVDGKYYTVKLGYESAMMLKKKWILGEESNGREQ